MRHVQNPQRELGLPLLQDIPVPKDTRDDLPAVLLGFQLLWSDRGFRRAVFRILNKKILPHTDRRQGRPGMDLLSILILGIVKQAKHLDFDSLQELANEHKTLRRFLGHSGIWDERRYSLKALEQNVNLLTPEILREISVLAVKRGRAILGFPDTDILFGAGDSYVAECDVHWPTDISLLRDAVRALILWSNTWAKERQVPGTRESKKNIENLVSAFTRVRKEKCAIHANVKSYLFLCAKRVKEHEKVVRALKSAGAPRSQIEKLEHFMKCARILMDQVKRRVLKGEKIPHAEKIFSVFEPHTRWISKGKAGKIAELGVPIHILAEQNGFILAAMIGWEGVDKDFAVPLVEEAQENFSQLRYASFDRGYHSPANQEALAGMLDCIAMPKKGKMNEAERERQSDPEFAMMARWHSRIESHINNLEQRGLDRVLSYGPDGFERMVNLSVLSLNVARSA